MASWSVFATSHGKSPCDGMGGVTKRMASRASLQAQFRNHIRTPKDLFDFASHSIKNVKYFYVTSAQVIAHAESFRLEEPYIKYKGITGTRMYHHYKPLTSGKMLVKRFSSDQNGLEIGMYQQDALRESFDDYDIDDYIACKYDKNWYVGLITEKSREQNDFHLKFMKHSEKSQSFTWPDLSDTCWVPVEDIICKIPTPYIKGISGRAVFKINEKDYQKLLKSVYSFFKK